jgi:hypothetical protein
LGNFGLGASIDLNSLQIQSPNSSVNTPIQLLQYEFNLKYRIPLIHNELFFLSSLGAKNLSEYFLAQSGSEVAAVPEGGLYLAEKFGIRYQPHSIPWDFDLLCTLLERTYQFPSSVSLVPEFEVKRWFNDRWWISLNYMYQPSYLTLDLVNAATGTSSTATVNQTLQIFTINLGIGF